MTGFTGNRQSPHRVDMTVDVKSRTMLAQDTMLRYYPYMMVLQPYDHR
jgi:hypothetical protein